MQYSYKIDGMHCEKCIDKIKLALLNHINVIEISLVPPTLTVESETPIDLKKLNTHLSTAGNYQAVPLTESVDKKINDQATNGILSYYPIFLITSYILGVSLINNVNVYNINWHGLMNDFMAGFFLVFSAFKFLNIKGFAEGYSTYDLLAKRWYTYGYIYPFLELSLGILYLTSWYPVATQVLTILIMGFSSLGVINSLMKKQTLKCACLGTILNVPLSSITLIEDLTMVALACLTLFLLLK